MGFFSKVSKKVIQHDKPEYLNQDFQELFTRYHSLSSALERELDNNSSDIKKTVFTGSKRSFTVYSISSKIKAIFEEYREVPYKERFEWEGFATSEFLDLVTNPDIGFRYNEAIQASPDNKGVISDVYRLFALEIARELDFELQVNGDSYSVNTELAYTKELDEILPQWDFLDLTSSQLDAVIESLSIRENIAIDRIGIIDEDTFTFKEKLHPEEGLTPAEKLVYSVIANDNGSYIALKAASGGFEVIEETLLRLKENDCIVFEGIQEAVHEELPDLGLTELVEGSGVEIIEDDDTSEIFDEVSIALTDESLDLTIEINESNFEVSDEFHYSEDDGSTDDWVMSTSDEKALTFTATGYTFDSLAEDVEVIMNRYEVGDDEARKIKAHVIANAELEAEVLRVEGILEPLTVEYAADFNDYSELKFEHGLKSISNDDETLHESIDEDDNASTRRDESNSAFFELSKLEEERFALNTDRRSELYGLLGSIPFYGDDQDTVSMQDRIELKLKGIDDVRNVAYHPSINKNVENYDEIIDVMVGDELLEFAGNLPDILNEGQGFHVDETISEIDEIGGREVIDAPLYYSLVDEMGFDPIELFKENARILRDGGDPLKPRETVWSTALNNSWIELNKASEAGE